MKKTKRVPIGVAVLAVAWFGAGCDFLQDLGFGEDLPPHPSTLKPEPMAPPPGYQKKTPDAGTPAMQPVPTAVQPDPAATEPAPETVQPETGEAKEAEKPPDPKVVELTKLMDKYTRQAYWTLETFFKVIKKNTRRCKLVEKKIRLLMKKSKSKLLKLSRQMKAMTKKMTDAQVDQANQTMSETGARFSDQVAKLQDDNHAMLKRFAKKCPRQSRRVVQKLLEFLKETTDELQKSM
jgi:hypothetical protein